MTYFNDTYYDDDIAIGEPIPKHHTVDTRIADIIFGVPIAIYPGIRSPMTPIVHLSNNSLTGDMT